MTEKLNFLKGTQASYNALTSKNENTFYRTSDKNLYLGDIHLNKQNVVFGTCMTRSDLAEKEIVITDTSWTITEGAILFVQFAATNEVSYPKFKINNQSYSVYTARGNDIIDLDGFNPDIYTQGGDETQILSYVYHNNAFYCQADEPEPAKVILFTANSCSDSFANVAAALMSRQKVYFFIEIEDEEDLPPMMVNLTFCGILDNAGLLFASHIPGIGEGMLLFANDGTVFMNAIQPGSITIGTDTWSEESGAHTDFTNAVNTLIQNYKPNYYGVCNTAASIATKEVTISGYFKLEPGAMIVVKFTNSNTASTPTLNVNNTGAKPLYRYGTTKMSSSSSTTGWSAGAVQLLVYDGTGWIRTYWANSTYSNAALGQGYGICETAEATLAKTASISSYSLGTGGIVAIRFINKVPANSTLNITSKGAKPIYYNNAAITNNVIQAGDTVTFIYNGTEYHLLSNDRWERDLRNLPQHGDEFSITDDIIHLKQGNGIVVDSNGIHHKDTSSQANITAADGKYISGLTFDTYGHVTGATASTNGLTTNGGSLVDGKTLKFSQYGNRFITISGNSIVADMSKVAGGWAGAFASVIHKDPNSTADDGTATTTLLGWYGGETDLTHIYMGGAYNDPYMKMTKDGYFTFKYRPKVGTTEAALITDIPVTLKNPNSLIFTGASTETYDGSSEVSVNLIGWAGTQTGAEIFNNSTNSASGYYSHAEGYNTIVSGNYSHAEGSGTNARGDYSHTEGWNTKTQASTFAAHAEGYGTEAAGNYSHAEGYGTKTTKNHAHAQGYNTIAAAHAAHASGEATQASGYASQAGGVNTFAAGKGSFTCGIGSGGAIQVSVKGDGVNTLLVSGDIPEGVQEGSLITTGVAYAIITGVNTSSKKLTISDPNSSGLSTSNPFNTYSYLPATIYTGVIAGYGAFAIGYNTKALNNFSVATGSGTIAEGFCNIAQGALNIPNTGVSLFNSKGTYVHIIGNGTSEDGRSNAYTLDWSGNAWFAGDVYVGSTSGTNKDAGSKKLATEDYVVNQFALNDAMIYKGVLNGANPTTYTPAADAGHTYKVATAGLINGVAVQVGDMLICTTDGTAAATADNVATIATQWNVIQTSDGTVTGPASSMALNGQIAVFDGTTGKLIKGSGKTVSSFLSSSITTLTLNSLTINDNILIGTKKTSTATGDRVLAIGQSLTMNGNNIIVHGSGSTATGTDSMASGYEAQATASAAHSFGSGTIASGSHSFAAGWDATASKSSSFALGEHVTASSQRQFVIGTYNVDDASSVYAFMIGNGTSTSAKSNAFAVKWTGDAVFAGDVYSGSIADTNKLVKKSEIGAAAAKGVTDSSSASAIGTGTSLVTERDIYYGLPTINNAHNYTSSTKIYAPTSGGTAGYVLRAAGATSAPTWESVKDSTSASAISTGTNLVTERDVYYGLASINNARQTSSVSVYAPTTGGTAGYTLVAAGATSAPTWNDTLTVDTTTGVAIKKGITLDNAVKFQYNNNDKCVDIIFI